MPGSVKGWAMFAASVIAVVAVSRLASGYLPLPKPVKDLLP